MSNNMKLQQQAVSPTSARAAHFYGLNSMHKDFLYAEVVSINGAGLKYSAETDGVLIDLTPPEITTLRHAARAPADLGYQVQKRWKIFLLLHRFFGRNFSNFQSVTDTLPMTIVAQDLESGIERIQLSFFSIQSGQRRLTGGNWLATGNDIMSTWLFALCSDKILLFHRKNSSESRVTFWKTS